MEEQVKYIPRRQAPKKKPVSLESGLQVACVRWFRMQYRQYANLLFAIPNGGHRNKAVAAKLKAEGVLAGIPDLLLAVPREGSHGLFIEMKVVYPDGKKKYTSPEQKQQIHAFRTQGYAVEVCYDLTQFIQVVNAYLWD